MPKRTDIQKIMIIGAGPIIIGQACEFDYSGTQACKALKEEGYEVILINSNPATIMTDPSFADKTYIEPITPDYVRKIIEIEKPDALLPTMGGQTALNTAVSLAHDGTLDEHNVELIGAKLDAIEVAEDRDKFKNLMSEIGLSTPKSMVVTNLNEGYDASKEIGFPIILRPAFTLGGYGGGIAYNQDELNEILVKGLNASPNRQVLLEQSVIGWKELEYEVMRDLNDNVVIICTIENLDPMGVHTGDSVTVAPVQTLSDKEFQELRDASIKVIRAVGVETGGSNIQFAINPANGEYIVIEMNPRVSRSSALASKATGFPIAKIAAKLAVGYTLDEIPNDITKTTMASFEPSIDYVVTKIPRFAFEKFPGSKDELGTQMKSVGETMAIGRTLKESVQKALRSLEKGSLGFLNTELINTKINLNQIKSQVDRARKNISKPHSKRLVYLFDALYLGITLDEIHNITKIDKWYLAHLKELVEETQRLQDISTSDDLRTKISADYLQQLKADGFSDAQLAAILKRNESEITDLRRSYDLKPVYKSIDTCAAEFESHTPYYYSTYEEESEVQASTRDKVIILGGGPNRIGQGIEFDYCCVHASQALQEAGYETIMINNNPETVSTDFDTSDRLYFEPITKEDVEEVWNAEKASLDDPTKLKGVIVQLGGQTPLNICQQLEEAGITILGTLPEKIDLAEDRDRFGQLLDALELKQTMNAIASSIEETREKAEQIGFPVVVRPSYVLGGRGMEIAYDERELNAWLSKTILEDTQFPILVDKFLDAAIEVDVDAVCDGETTEIAGIMEHIEYAGVHSGDSSSVYPPQTLSANMIQQITKATKELAKALDVRGLMNIQFAIKNEELYILEVNPRASRTVPFISKATGVSWAKIASRVMLGEKLSSFDLSRSLENLISVKEAVFSFNKFEGTNIFLGPEMKSTGEVMGISDNFPLAFAKAQTGSSMRLPKSGKVFCSLSDKDKTLAIDICKGLERLGFEIVATSGTASFLEQMGIKLDRVKKVSEGRPNIADMLKNDEISLIFNVPAGKEAYEDSTVITKIAMANNIPVITTITGAAATVQALESLQSNPIKAKALQDHMACSA